MVICADVIHLARGDAHYAMTIASRLAHISGSRMKDWGEIAVKRSILTGDILGTYQRHLRHDCLDLAQKGVRASYNRQRRVHLDRVQSSTGDGLKCWGVQAGGVPHGAEAGDLALTVERQRRDAVQRTVRRRPFVAA